MDADIITTRPRSAEDVADAVADGVRTGARLEIRGGGTKAEFGAPAQGAKVLDTGGLAGIVDYDPDELVLTVGAGTPLAEIEALVASRGQMLAFEPFDHGPIYGEPAGRATIGGIVAAGVSGSRRLSAGAVRDHLLGFEAVSGTSEVFVAGGKVVKNVTGYDLPKLLAGSWGRLAVLTNLTLKVLPRGRVRRSVMVEGLDPLEAQRLMDRALRSQAEVSAAGYAPAADAPARTAFRLEGFEPSIRARVAMLRSLVGDRALIEASAEDGDAFWTDLRTLAPLQGEGLLWRLSIPPAACASLLRTLEPLGGQYLADWGGALVWLLADGHADLVRSAAAMAGGHATLVRAPVPLRDKIPALHPQPGLLVALERRVRAAFDPQGVFETGRFGVQEGGVSAN
jgi:glycolate oxidase FAD binding subunit